MVQVKIYYSFRRYFDRNNETILFAHIKKSKKDVRIHKKIQIIKNCFSLIRRDIKIKKKEKQVDIKKKRPYTLIRQVIKQNLVFFG